jgi:hypothetical protein
VSDDTETSSSSSSSSVSYSESDSRLETEAYLSYDNKSSDFGPDFEFKPPPPPTTSSSLTAPCAHPPAIKDHYITARVQDITAKRHAFLISRIEKWTSTSRSQVSCLYSKAIERGWARRCQ